MLGSGGLEEGYKRAGEASRPLMLREGRARVRVRWMYYHLFVRSVTHSRKFRFFRCGGVFFD